MKTLITQKAFADKVGISPSQLSRDFVKKGLLPMEGTKIVMPDAEKTYFRYLGGVIEHQEPKAPQPANAVHWKYKDNSHGKITLDDNGLNLTLPEDKQMCLQCEEIKINLSNYDDDIDCSLRSATKIISFIHNKHLKTSYSWIELADFSIIIVEDKHKTELINGGANGGLDNALDDPDNNCYLLTESELLELIKSKLIGDKRYL